MKFISELENKIIIPDEHWYQGSSGNWLPSVTAVIDVYPKGQNFVRWLMQVGMNAKQIIEEAGIVGSNVHAAIDFFLKGQEIAYMKDGKEIYTWEEWVLICKAMEFFNNFSPKILVHEFSFAIDEFGYGGTIDIICEINGEIWLIDYKTSNMIHQTAFLQVAAYRQAWDYLNPHYKIQRSGVLHLKAQTRGEDKKGEKIQGDGWKIIETENYEDDLKFFNYCLDIWRRENKNARPKQEEYPFSFKLKNEYDGKENEQCDNGIQQQEQENC